jgi:hypothetical protein
MESKASSFFNFIKQVKGIDPPFIAKLKMGEVKEGDSFGDVKIRNGENIIIPDNLSFHNLALQFCDFTNLPNNLSVQNDLNLSHLDLLEHLPTTISAKDLFISGSLIKTIPSFFRNGVKSIVCYKMPNLVEIKLNEFDFLNIDRCESLIKLSDNLNLKFALKVYDTPLEHIGKNTKIYYETLLNNTNVSDFPEGFHPGKYLSIKDSPVMKKYTIEQLKERFPLTEVFYN